MEQVVWANQEYPINMQCHTVIELFISRGHNFISFYFIFLLLLLFIFFNLFFYAKQLTTLDLLRKILKITHFTLAKKRFM